MKDNLVQLFNFWDCSNSGVISLGQFTNYLISVGLAPNANFIIDVYNIYIYIYYIYIYI